MCWSQRGGESRKEEGICLCEVEGFGKERGEIAKENPVPTDRTEEFLKRRDRSTAGRVREVW